MILLRLFYEFFKTGLFAVGGGMATIPFLQNIGATTGWFTDADLTTMIAVSESTPGAMGVNMATYVGFTIARLHGIPGVIGAIVATLGLTFPSIVVIIIIAREFIISGFRLIASDNGVVIAASYWGKFKTTFQMVMICLMIANFPQLQILTNIIMWIALILTVVSLIDYLVKNKDVMKEEDKD